MIPQIDFYVFNKGLVLCPKAWTKGIPDTPLFDLGDFVFTPEMTFSIFRRVYDTTTHRWRLYGETLTDTCPHLRGLKSTDAEPVHPLTLAGWEKVALTPQQLLEVTSG